MGKKEEKKLKNVVQLEEYIKEPTKENEIGLMFFIEDVGVDFCAKELWECAKLIVLGYENSEQDGPVVYNFFTLKFSNSFFKVCRYQHCDDIYYAYYYSNDKDNKQFHFGDTMEEDNSNEYVKLWFISIAKEFFYELVTTMLPSVENSPILWCSSDDE